MKRRLFFALGAIAVITASCDGGVSTKPALASDTDTIAYAYGLNVAEQGLVNYITQMGVLTDTASFKMQYEYQLQEEADTVKRAALKNALPAKLDSIAKANKRNLKDFIKGMNKGYNSSDKESAYNMGLQIGAQLKQMSENLSTHVFGDNSKEQLNKKNVLAGIVTILKKEKPLLDNAQVIFEAKIQKITEDRKRIEYAPNLEAGQKYLEANKAQEGVITLPDGLQYKVITEGKGDKPAITDRVKVRYTGKLIDGTVFDSTSRPGSDSDNPMEFGVGQNIIRGWTEALLLMPVGSKWEVYIPQELAYGSQESGLIKPFSALVFEMELVEIVKPETEKK
jgi:FKBP-type peptidyl-prolyl cis-trans isomerase FklB